MLVGEGERGVDDAVGEVAGGGRRPGADGVEVVAGPGEAFYAAPGHDAWVVGDEPCVALDFVSD